MPKVVIIEKGKPELLFLNFDVEELINQIIKKIPISDLKGISHIYVTDLPEKSGSNTKTNSGAYFKKYKNTPAFIEI